MRLRSSSRLRGSWPQVLIALGAVGLAGAGLASCGTGSGSSGGGEGGNPGVGGETTTTGSGGATGAGGATTTTGAGGTTGGGVGGAAGAGTGGRIGAGGMTTAGVGGITGAGGAAPPVTAYWISPTGSDANAGTQAAPFLTLYHASLFAHAGITIWINPGTYNAPLTPVGLSANGTATSMINVFAVAGGARPVVNFAIQQGQAANDALRGINITGDYWHLRGFEVKNANDNGIAISGSHNLIEDMIVDGCGDTGIQITVPSAQASDATRGAFNTILNCDSHDNIDVATGGENADGIDAKLDIGPGNVFRGCRSYNNSDDGYDLFGVTQIVTIDNCWAMLNGHTASGQKGPAADGNGFKLGGNNAPAAHVVTNSFSMTNDTCGFTLNSNTLQPKVTACGVFQNKTGTFCDGLTHSGDVTLTTAGSAAITMPRLTNVAAGASSLPVIH